jgi:hypothetical protein
MIRINLLKKITHIKGKKKSPAIPVWVPVVTGVVIIMLAAYGTSSFWLPKAKKEPVPLPVVTQKTEFKPSTHIKPNMIEEVVKEINEERASNQKNGFINLTYDDMSFAEKINYEILFTHTIFDTLRRTIPSGIGFKTLEIDNFLTLYSIGIGSSADIVTETFARLKNDMGLLPPPYSSIKQSGTGSYRFVITCKPSFGVDLASQYQPIDHLFRKSELRNQLTEFTNRAKKNDLNFSGTPVSEKVTNIREFNRYEYSWKCTGTYMNFVQFINLLYSDQFPCAFRTVHIKALTGSNVEISTNLIFTVKE